MSDLFTLKDKRAFNLLCFFFHLVHLMESVWPVGSLWYPNGKKRRKFLSLVWDTGCHPIAKFLKDAAALDSLLCGDEMPEDLWQPNKK